MRQLVSASGVVAAVLLLSCVIASSGAGCGTESNTVGSTDAGRIFILSVRPSSATKNVGEVQTFEAALTADADDSALSRARWESSNPAIATVDATTGAATAVAPGTATITVRLDDVSASATLNVLAPPDGAVPPDGGGAGTQLVYVSSLGGESVPSIRVFALDAKDDAAPIRSIVGASTKLSAPSQMAVIGNELFVAGGNKEVLVFDVAASGDVPPKRVIAGDNTGFTNFSPTGIVGFGSELFVSDQQLGILVFPTNAMGDVAPTRTNTFAGANHLSTSAIANEIVVATGNEVRGYLKTATGTATTLRTLPSVKAGARGVHATTNAIYVATTEGHVGATADDAIVVFSGTAMTGATPIRTIAGVTSTGLNDPHGMGVAGGDLFVANQGDSSVRVWAETADGDVAPKRVIKGMSTGLAFPAGLLIVTMP
jgi:hypothetical protein